MCYMTSMNNTLAIVAQVRNRARAFAKERQWSRYRFAKEAGLHKNTLRDLWRDDWNPSLETLQKLDAVMTREVA